jgi:NAD+ diphosphatase
MLLWQQQANFCMVCGRTLQPIPNEWGKRCPNCGYTVYPPVSPCTITLIHDGENILMTHKDGWGPRYGLVAGFVEPGESLEENVRREVFEETGVQITDIRYWRSQPWPFPHQIMCGFYARYVSGEVKIDANELDDARWFSKSDIRGGTPVIPPPLSIARQLIDEWMSQS